VQVSIYSGSYSEEPQQASALPVRATVEVLDGWTVGDVLEAAGYYPHNSFGLSPIAPETGADSSSPADWTITGVFNLGVDARGVIRAGATQNILWQEFLRAVEDGLYEGDPSQVVVYDYGSAGGLTPDGLWEVVQFLFANRDLGAQAMAQVAAFGGGSAALVAGGRWASGVRRRHIARTWRKAGFTAARTRWYLNRCPQWDPELLATRLELTAPEARLALFNAGYRIGEDQLWRLDDSAAAQLMRDALARIEAAAYENSEDGWQDDFPLTTPPRTSSRDLLPTGASAQTRSG
jgi:hypothetical protein